MLYRMDAVLLRVRFLLVGLTLTVGLLLVALWLLSWSASSTPASDLYSSTDESPNAVTRIVFSSINGATETLGATTRVVSNTAHAIITAPAESSTIINTVGMALYHGAQHGAAVIDHGVAAALRLPGNIAGAIGRLPAAILRPTAGTAVPTIDATLVSTHVAAASPVSNKPLNPQPSVKAAVAIRTAPQQPIWPIHGRITTLFGVPELPYERIHTGLDISDGKPAGVTPIHPFKPGRIAQVVHGGGLGNHVVIAHGSGMTSVYGHLDSTTVHVGQLVTEQTVIGYEGSTGASTGPHLHFEIRINGRPANPEHYISGLP